MKICFLITSSCNLNCDFCFAPKLNTHILKSLVAKYINILKNKSIRKVTISGGEPLLHPKLFDILELFRKNKINVSLNTNGLLLNKPNIEKLKNLVSKISLSFDGDNDLSFFLMRKRKGLFKHIIKTLCWLSKFNIPVEIHTLVTKINYNNVMPIGELIKKYKNILYWKLFQFIPKYNGKKHSQKFKISKKQFLRVITKIKETYPTLRILCVTEESFVNTYLLIYPNGSVWLSNKEYDEKISQELNEFVLENAFTKRLEF